MPQSHSFWWLPSALAVGFAVVHMHLTAAPASERHLRVFTPKELAAFDGRGGGPVYLAIMGRVFDVSAGREFYEPGAGYECFAGRDASLAFVTGDFAGDRTDDVGALSGKQLAELAGWVNGTYHAKYAYLGVLGGGYFFDANGRETPAGRDVARRVAAESAAARVRAADLRRYPRCASKRAAGAASVSCKGGRVPRRRDAGDGDGRDRCACVDAAAAAALPGDFRPYDGCAPGATTCAVP